MSNPLDYGSTTFGTLVDGYEDTEHFPCALRVSEFGKISIDVSFPYLEPFNLLETGEYLWVNRKPIPNHMVMLHDAGQVELFGIRFTGSSSSFGGAKTDRISCDVDFAVEGQVPDRGENSTKIVSLRQDFLDSKSIANIQIHRLDLGISDESNSKERSLIIPSNKEIWRWKHNGIEHAISEVHAVFQERGKTEITSRLEFTSTTEVPIEFQDMEQEQRKFVALMQIVNNKQILLVSPRVLFEYSETPIHRKVRSGRMRNSLVRASSEREVRPCISPFTLTSGEILRWYEEYDRYYRPISALNSLLPRVEIDAEERMINSFIALESIGHLSLGLAFGAKEPAYSFVEECLKILGVTSLEFASSIRGFSKALAGNYNGIKHLRSGAFPDSKDTFVFGLLAQAISRASLLTKTIGTQVDWFKMSEVEVAQSIAKKEGLYINDQGDY